ncbi:MAG: helix-turn-helix domain-containing protein [Defluviitaleaceae bacterium]|nr:helix-turn-helix domain-containing protein [Defluviitaleaceae bacterium]
MLKGRLKNLREMKKLSQSMVAEALGVSRQVYNNYELGKREPDNKIIMSMTNYFNVTTDYLLGNSDAFMPVYLEEKEPDNNIKKSIRRDNAKPYFC